MSKVEQPGIQFNDGDNSDNTLEPPPDYVTATTGQTQPVVPSAPPASVIDQQPRDPYPPQPVSADPNIETTTTTTTIYVNTTERERRTRERSCCEDTYCPGFIFCFYVPTPCPGPAAGNCSCDCLPPTTACCEGGFGFASVLRLLRCGGGDNPIAIIITLIVLAVIVFALIGIIAFLIYRLGDDKPPAIAKRIRICSVVFAVIAYTIMIAVGIALAIVYA